MFHCLYYKQLYLFDWTNSHVFIQWVISKSIWLKMVIFMYSEYCYLSSFPMPYHSYLCQLLYVFFSPCYHYLKKSCVLLYEEKYLRLKTEKKWSRICQSGLRIIILKVRLCSLTRWVRLMENVSICEGEKKPLKTVLNTSSEELGWESLVKGHHKIRKNT